MKLVAAPWAIAALPVVLACHPTPRGHAPPAHAPPGAQHEPQAPRTPHASRPLHQPMQCTPSAQEPLGDPIGLGVEPGDWVRTLDALTRVRPHARADAHAAGWVARERVVWPDYAFVALERPGNDAALVMLAPAQGGYCVRAVWGFAFGGNGVTLSISDTARAAGGVALVAIEAMAEYNNPVDATDDPFEHRRIVLAVAPARAAVIADTQAEGPLAPYDQHHWYFTDTEPPCAPQLVATDLHGSQRWCFDKDRWALEPLVSGPGSM